MWACFTLPVIPSRAPPFPLVQSSPARPPPPPLLPATFRCAPLLLLPVTFRCHPRLLLDVLRGRVVSGGANKDKLPQRPWWECTECEEAWAVAAVRWSRCWACSAATAGAPLCDVFWLRFLDKKSVSSSKYVRATGVALLEAGVQLPQTTIQLTQPKNFFKLLYVRRPALPSPRPPKPAAASIYQGTSLFEMSIGWAVNSHRGPDSRGK